MFFFLIYTNFLKIVKKNLQTIEEQEIKGKKLE